MFGFLTFGTTLTVADLAVKNEIERRDGTAFPKEMKGSRGWIKLHKSHNSGLSFGFFKGNRLVKMIPLCITSGVAGTWIYMMGVRGMLVEKLALTLVLAGGMSNLLDRIVRGYVVDYFSIEWKALKKVIFNLADIFIILGSVILVLSQAAGAIRDEIKSRK